MDRLPCLITTYVSRALGLSLCEQAAQSRVGERTLRRWASGDCEPQAATWAAYLRWLTSTGGLATRLDHDSAISRSPSMPRGLRPYALAAREGGLWSWVLLVLDARGQLVAWELGDCGEPVISWEDLRSYLLRLAHGLAAALDVEEMMTVTPAAPRIAGGGLSSKYWSLSADVGAAHIRALMLMDLARRGDLDDDSLNAALLDLNDKISQLNALAAELRAEQAGQGAR